MEWTEAADALLTKRWVVEDVPAPVIAKEIGHGLTTQAVRARAHSLGLKRVEHRPQTPPGSAPRLQRQPLPPVTPAGPGAKTLMDLAFNDRQHCKWPVGPDGGEGQMYRQLFCGDQAEPGLPYCATHGEMARPQRRAS